MIVKCVVAGLNEDRKSDLILYKIECTEEQYRKGDYHAYVHTLAKEIGLKPFGIYDQNSNNNWLLDHFDWDLVPTTPIK